MKIFAAVSYEASMGGSCSIIKFYNCKKNNWGHNKKSDKTEMLKYIRGGKK